MFRQEILPFSQLTLSFLQSTREKKGWNGLRAESLTYASQNGYWHIAERSANSNSVVILISLTSELKMTDQ